MKIMFLKFLKNDGLIRKQKASLLQMALSMCKGLVLRRWRSSGDHEDDSHPEANIPASGSIWYWAGADGHKLRHKKWVGSSDSNVWFFHLCLVGSGTRNFLGLQFSSVKIPILVGLKWCTVGKYFVSCKYDRNSRL